MTGTTKKQELIEKLRQTMNEARTNADALMNEAIAALDKAETAGSNVAGNVFQKAADRALTASENWREAGENLRQALQGLHD